MSSKLQLDVCCLSCCGGDIWWTLTKERQAWCYLQVKLCDACLSALSVPPWPKRRYINTLPFLSFTDRGRITKQSVPWCLYTQSNKTVFSFLRNESVDRSSFRSVVSLFRARGAATEKALSPIHRHVLYDELVTRRDTQRGACTSATLVSRSKFEMHSGMSTVHSVMCLWFIKPILFIYIHRRAVFMPFSVVPIWLKIAKFHYASWFGASGSELAPNQLA